MIINFKNLLRIGVLLGLLSVYFVMGFNCSASKMHSLLGNGSMESNSASKSENLPYALLNAEQALSSMLNVTEQPQASTGVRNEFNIRNSAFSVNSYLSSMNAPMLLSATSLAGEVCNSLVARERALTATERIFFGAVNFATGPSQIAAADYERTVRVLTNKVWGRAPTSAEVDLFTEFYADFLLDLPAAERTQNAKTSALYISVCAAALSSFDALTY
jgi:hypothetical protein